MPPTKLVRAIAFAAAYMCRREANRNKETNSYQQRAALTTGKLDLQEQSKISRLRKTYMGSSETGPVVGLHALFKVAFGLLDEEAGLGTTRTAKHRIRDDAARLDGHLGAFERRHVCGDVFDLLLV